MKRILLSLLTLTAVIIGVTTTTRAYFADTENSDANTFAAGTLDLEVNDENDPITQHVTLNNIKPGDKTYDGNGVPITDLKWKLTNVGSLPGTVRVEFVNVVNNDNGCLEPESDAGDLSCGNNQGELASNLLMSTWKSTSGSYFGSWASGFHTFSSYTNQDWNLNGTVTLASGETIYVGLKFDLPSSVSNIIQSDSTVFDVVFHLDQV